MGTEDNSGEQSQEGGSAASSTDDGNKQTTTPPKDGGEGGGKDDTGGTSKGEGGGQEPKPPWGSDDDFDPQRAWNLIQNLRSEVDDLKPKASKLKELEDKDKTELQRTNEALETERAQSAEAKTEAAKLRAAIKHGLSEDDLELLGTGTPEQIEQRAERLAARLAGTEEQEPVVPSSRNQGGSNAPAAEDVQKAVDQVPPS